MMRGKGRIGLWTAACLAAWSGMAAADVKVQDRTAVKFGGMLGGVVNVLGGKAAREGVTSTTAVKGDRRARFDDNTGEIVDLKEEKVYDVDMKNRTYTVTTFAELRRREQEQEAKARREAPEQEETPSRPDRDAQPAEPSAPQKQMDVDFSMKDTGQKRTVNGFDTHEVVMTAALHEKGRTLEQSGGLVLTTDMWVAPGAGSTKDLLAFDQRYMEKLHGPVATAEAQAQMAMLLGTYPELRQGMSRMQAEGTKVDGNPVLTTVTIEVVKSPEQMAQAEQSRSDEGGGLGGLRGKLGRKLGGKKDDAAASGPKNRSLLMTTTHEVLTIAPQVSDADVAVPAGFRQK